MKPLYLFGKEIGFVKFSEEFEKKVFVSKRTYKHFFFLHNGFGFSRNILQLLKRVNVEVLIILYHHDGLVEKLVTSMTYLEENGIRYQNKFDAQIVLPINEFNQYLLEEVIT